MKAKTLLVVVAMAVLVCAPAAFAQNLVTNGGFETGDFTGWNEVGNFEFSQVVSGPFVSFTGAQEGSFYATFGPVGSQGGISQSFSDTAGGSYLFSFWLNAVGDDPSSVTVMWDGTTVLSQTDPNTGNVWTNFTFNETGTGHDTITFLFQDDPAYIALDNVSVTPSGGTTSVPEPSSLLLMGSGALALAGVIRRKFRG
ncbi:MAG TPA: PEP-CTERM sorting domain-containing protein [Terriglobales bacterium]|nr:PEP-CTERM sorting domain-containing protein [Terriglobales bacterium]